MFHSITIFLFLFIKQTQPLWAEDTLFKNFFLNLTDPSLLNFIFLQLLYSWNYIYSITLVVILLFITVKLLWKNLHKDC